MTARPPEKGGLAHAGAGPRPGDPRLRAGRSRRRWALPAAIVVLALVVRVVVVVADPGYEPRHDAFDYDRHGRAIAAGEGYPESVFVPGGGPTALRSPAWPYLLGATYAVAGEHVDTGRLLGALLGAVAVALLYAIVAFIWGRRTAIVAAALAAVFPPLVLLSKELFAESLFVTVVLAIVFCVLRYRHTRALRWAVAAGAACGLAALTAKSGVALTLVAALGVWTGRPRFSARGLLAPAAVALCAALVLVPWAIRNAAEFGRFVPVSTSTGFALAGTYNETSLADDSDPASWRTPVIVAEYGPLFRLPDVDEATLDTTLRRESIEFALEHPGYVAEVGARNLLRLFGTSGDAVVGLDGPVEQSGIGNRASAAERIGLAIVVPLALLGLLALVRRPPWRTGDDARVKHRLPRGPLFLWLVPVLLIALAVPVAGLPRYRTPVDPFLLILAAIGAVWAFDRLRPRLAPGRAAALVAAAACALVAAGCGGGDEPSEPTPTAPLEKADPAYAARADAICRDALAETRELRPGLLRGRVGARHHRCAAARHRGPGRPGAGDPRAPGRSPARAGAAAARSRGRGRLSGSVRPDRGADPPAPAGGAGRRPARVRRARSTVARPRRRPERGRPPRRSGRLRRGLHRCRVQPIGGMTPAAPGAGDQRPAPDVLTPPPHHPRFPLADGVRGVAAIGVVLVHTWLFTGGFNGFADTLPNRAMVRLDGLVVFFFVLSAFLLYRPMIAHRAGGPAGLTLSRYARSRFLRVYPPYWVVLTALAIFPGLVGVFSGDWWKFYTLLSNFDQNLYGNPECFGQTFVCGLPQTWTLTTEITFYLMLPAYAALTERLARGRSVRSWARAELALLAGLAALSIFLNVPPVDLRNETWFRFSFIGHFYWLGLGLAFAVVSVGLRGQMPRWLDRLAATPALAWGGTLALYGLMVAVFPAAPFIVARDTTLEFLGLHLAQGAFAALFLVPVLLGNPNSSLPRRLLANPVIAWLGLVSYGIYLWHVTIAYDLGTGGGGAGFWTVLIGTVALSVPLAALVHYAIERPLLRVRERPLRNLLRRRRAPKPG